MHVDLRRNKNFSPTYIQIYVCTELESILILCTNVHLENNEMRNTLHDPTFLAWWKVRSILRQPPDSVLTVYVDVAIIMCSKIAITCCFRWRWSHAEDILMFTRHLLPWKDRKMLCWQCNKTAAYSKLSDVSGRVSLPLGPYKNHSVTTPIINSDWIVCQQSPLLENITKWPPKWRKHSELPTKVHLYH